MKKTNTKSKNKAFLDKIKTLSFSVGGKYTPPPKQHGIKYLGTAEVTVTKYPRTPQERKENEAEEAFSA